MADRKHALYRFFGHDGELLYVGITMNPAARWPQHQQSKSWWQDVADISVETMDSRREALDAEREAIKTERPTYNVVHAERVTDPEPQPAPSRFRWVCDHCEEDVEDRDGDIAVSIALANDYRAFLRNVEEEDETRSYQAKTLDALLNGPGPARWIITHFECDMFEDADQPVYAIAIEQIRTPAQLLSRTAHIMGKRWFTWTNWDYVVARAAVQGGARP